MPVPRLVGLQRGPDQLVLVRHEHEDVGELVPSGPGDEGEVPPGDAAPGVEALEIGEFHEPRLAA